MRTARQVAAPPEMPGEYRQRGSTMSLYLRRSGAARALLVLTMAGALGACSDGEFSLPTFESADTGADADLVSRAQTTTELVERDVEAPDVFQVTEAGLWDGRPSLGGVWVAHPDVAEPERVIIRNTETGSFVIGALFRRERENPGPALQVSSDAADALQMLAGSPASLNVTALRREPVPSVETPEPVASFDAPAEIEATTLDDPIAGAEAALAQIEAAEATAAPAAEVTPVSAPAPTASSPLDRPFIQIGIFSIEANAANSATAMRTAGLPAEVIRQASQGSTFWRVIVGPATSEAQREQYLATVKDRGFTDAYFVRN